eukprot:TRINITY_DN5012_c0_g2_i1.p1 TRINITY_DN5012_c0_g2~~TRINITY_DN5012_c0_g2_i1.p1  ORF type:complete len:327 (+),score=42.68 TRINITY_DN5012_c0_g2_i1:53-1033(+)
MYFVVLFLLFCSFFCVNGLGYGDEFNGLPLWSERANHALTNAVRMDPSKFKTIYTSGELNDVLDSYSGVTPLAWLLELNKVANDHSVDMATNCGLSHNSCDGTDTFVRISSALPTNCSGGAMGENVSNGSEDPLSTLIQWLCDKDGTSCCPDNSGCDGHRSNILGSQYKSFGVGNRDKYWTQDFISSLCTTSRYEPPKIWSGSHIFLNSKIHFLATYWDNSGVQPSDASIVIEGQSYSLSLNLNDRAQGNYFYEETSSSGCREYYFMFTDSLGNTSYYPAQGSLVTYNEGGCTKAWTSSRKDSSSGNILTTGFLINMVLCFLWLVV